MIAVLAIPVSLVWVLFAIIFAPNGERALAIILAYDRLGNAMSGGDGRETISSRIGRLQGAPDTMPKWAAVLGGILDKLQANHCRDAIGM
ncbi:MAG: hypothetical protein WCD45_04020 [Gallionella sp.]